MNKLIRAAAALLVAIMVAGVPSRAEAQSLDNLFGMLGDMAEGVLSKTNLSVDDISGEWTANGSAVSFKSDNFLKKAGGSAAAGLIENKLDPYYNKLGLNNAVLTIKDDNTFSLKVRKIILQGTLESNGDGTFIFNFKALKSVSLGKLTTYVQKSGNKMDVMFDAKKLMSLVSGVAKLTGISIAKTAASLLDSYDGMCVGFKMKKTGNVESTKPSSSTSASGSVKGATEVLGNILGGASSSKGAKSSNSGKQDSTSVKSESSKPAARTDTTANAKEIDATLRLLMNSRNRGAKK